MPLTVAMPVDGLQATVSLAVRVILVVLALTAILTKQKLTDPINPLLNTTLTPIHLLIFIVFDLIFIMGPVILGRDHRS